ncbi:MAG: hypothetical protein O2809_07555 [Proteobacteria bacterium]|nr:hypothetical protein [Pseudomonadota bacterium]
MEISKREFARNPLKIVTQVQESAEEITVTHRGVPSVTIRKLTEEEKEAHRESRESSESLEVSCSESISQDYPAPFEFCIHRAYGELLNACAFVLNCLAAEVLENTDDNKLTDRYSQRLSEILVKTKDFDAEPGAHYTDENHRYYLSWFTELLDSIISYRTNMDSDVKRWTTKEKEIMQQWLQKQAINDFDDFKSSLTK